MKAQVWLLSKRIPAGVTKVLGLNAFSGSSSRRLIFPLPALVMRYNRKPRSEMAEITAITHTRMLTPALFSLPACTISVTGVSISLLIIPSLPERAVNPEVAAISWPSARIQRMKSAAASGTICEAVAQKILLQSSFGYLPMYTPRLKLLKSA